MKLNLKIVSPPFPSYERLEWNYKNVDFTAIRPLDLVHWDFIFLNKTFHDQALAFDQVPMKMLLTMYPTNVSTLMNKNFTNYVPNKCKSFDDQDLTWTND